MSIEYLGLSDINGPLIAIEGVEGAAFEEIVEITVDNKEKKLGRIVELYKDKDRDEAEALATAISSHVAHEIEPYTDGLYVMTPFRRVELIARIIREIL